MVDHYIEFPEDTSERETFQFQTSVSEGLLTVSVSWNIADQRWYFKVTNSHAKTIAYRPLIGSPASYDINLFRHISQSKCVYREKNRTFEITT